MIVINNTTAGATNAGVIDMQPGEYLMDVINAINALPDNEKPTESNPLTINMYNHNFTVDYDRITAKVVIPKHVFIHLAGNYLHKNDEIATKSFIGFDFSGASKFALPMDRMAFRTDEFNVAETEADIAGGTWDEYSGVTLICAMDTKKLWLKRGTELIDVTVILQGYTVDSVRLGVLTLADCKGSYFNNADCKGAEFSYADCKDARFGNADCQYARFSNADCKGAVFSDTSCQGANFEDANCQGANFKDANCQGANFKHANFNGIQLNNQCNFQGANLTGVQNMPATLNTKAKFISVVGVGNVNAQTIWIDGTSILS